MTQTELDMRPPLTSLDIADGALINTVSGGYRRLRARVCSNSKNLLSGQLGAVVIFAKLAVIKTLRGCISRIFGYRSKIQMRWIDTGFVVTSMAYAHAFGYWPIPMLVSKTMSGYRPVINLHLAISVCVSPYPAIANLVEPRHELSESGVVHWLYSLTHSSSASARRWMTSTIVSPVSAAISRNALRVSTHTLIVTCWCFMVAILQQNREYDNLVRGAM